MTVNKPISDEEQDLLRRSGFAEKILDMLINDQTNMASGQTIGLIGPWGSGKSSVLNLIKHHAKILADDPSKVDPLIVSFNPWLVTERDLMIAEFLGHLANELKRDDDLKEAAAALIKYANRILGTAEGAIKIAEVAGVTPPFAKPITNSVRAAVSALSHLFGIGETDSTNLEVMRNQVNEKLAVANHPIIIIIDDLDRLDDSEIKIMVQIVRALLDLDKVSFLLAYDGRRVAEALGDGRTDEARAFGRSYLEKVVPLAIDLPQPTNAALITMLEEGLLDAGINSADIRNSIEWQQLVDILIPHVLAQPRDIKRAISRFSTLRLAIDEDEIPWVTLMGLAALQTKWPRKARRIADYVFPAERKNLPPGLTDDLQITLDDKLHRYYDLFVFDESHEEIEDSGEGLRKLKRLVVHDPAYELIGFLLPGLVETQYTLPFENSLADQRLAAVAFRPVLQFPAQQLTNALCGTDESILATFETALEQQTLSSLLGLVKMRWAGFANRNHAGVLRALVAVSRTGADLVNPYDHAKSSKVHKDCAELISGHLIRDRKTEKIAAEILMDLAKEGDGALLPELLERAFDDRYRKRAPPDDETAPILKTLAPKLLGENRRSVVRRYSSPQDFLEIQSPFLFSQCMWRGLSGWGGDLEEFHDWLEHPFNNPDCFAHFAKLCHKEGFFWSDRHFELVGTDVLREFCKMHEGFDEAEGDHIGVMQKELETIGNNKTRSQIQQDKHRKEADSYDELEEPSLVGDMDSMISHKKAEAEAKK